MEIYNKNNRLKTSQSYIFGKNDFSKMFKNKENNINLDIISLDNYSSIKTNKKDNKNRSSNKYSHFKKILEKTFSTPLEQTLSSPLNYHFYDNNIEKNNLKDISPVNTINTQSFQRSKSSNLKINLSKSKNLNLKNKNKSYIQPQEYVNKNYNKVFGEEKKNLIDKTLRIYYQINKIKNNLKSNSLSKKNDIFSKPEFRIKEPRIFFNENNDKSISFYRNVNNIIKPNKRNLNYIDVCNNNQNNNYKIKNILFKRNDNLYYTENSNFSNYKNNIGKLNLFNDKNQEVENYKKSFKSNKSKDFIFQKYLKTLK